MDIRSLARSGPAAIKSLSLGRRSEKVFAIGFNKTGTSSLHKVFRTLGYSAYHGTKWRETSRPVIHRLYDAFSDGIPDDFRVLDSKFPRARFILQVRDLSPWLDSRLEHIRRLPPEMTRHPEWTASPEAIATWVRKWNAHHLDVMSYFADRPADLLVINFIRDPDAADRVAAFLDHDVALAKPHANRNPEVPHGLKNDAMIESVLSELHVPGDERFNDIYCPSVVGNVAGVASDTSRMTTTP